MNTYWALYSARFRVLLQYRVAALAGLATQIFWGVVRMMILEGFYSASSAPPPMTLDQTVTYIWLGQGFFRMIPWAADRETTQKIRDGSVAYDLVRPVDLYWSWYFRALAMLSGPTLMRALPLLTVAWFFFGMRGPASFAHFAAWAPSIMLGLLLSAAIVTNVSISLFWTISGEGISRMLPAVVWVFSGIVIPLPFLPDRVRMVLEFLPPSSIIDTPFRIYTGQYAPEQFSLHIGLQVFWILAVVLFGRTAMARGIRRLVVQGG
jgi:ABC-2 type transport system permease protein